MDPSAPPPRKAAVAFIFVTVVLDMLALGISVPVLPKLVLGFYEDDAAGAATVFGVFGFSFAAMQFLLSPLLGALSDRFGRRRIVLISNLGLGLDYLLMALAPNVAWIFVGRVVAGGCSASIGAAGAYIADVTPPDKRAASFGLLNVAFGLGFVLGPAVGGLLGAVSPRLPFWLAAGLSLANAAYGLLVLPESLPASQRGRFEWRRANPLGALLFLRRRGSLLGLAVISFLAAIAHAAAPSTFVLYADHRYGWDERAVGFAIAAIGLCSAAVGAWLVGASVKRVGERRSLLVGLAFGVLGFAGYGLAPTGFWFGLAIPLQALWGLAGPATQGLMTRQLESREQGRLQGAVTSLRGVAEMVGPPLFTGAFAASIGESAWLQLPGAPFLLASAILLAAWFLALLRARAPASPAGDGRSRA